MKSLDDRLDEMQVKLYNATTNEDESAPDIANTVVNPVVDLCNELQQLQQNPLDEEKKYHTVDLLKHLSISWLKSFVKQIAEQCDLPEGTVLLNLIGIFSSVACRNWRVLYEHAGTLPIGLYVIAEQPPATSKTRCQRIAQKPFYDIKREVIEDYKQDKSRLEAIDNPSEAQSKELDTLKQMSNSVYSKVFISNATPEGAEKTLLTSRGYFSAVSSEQGLFNSLLGFSYSKNSEGNNNDMLLNGFDGGFVSSCRVSREGYHGYVIGGATLFAQPGSVEKIIVASNGTGLAERFLLIAEPHSLGKRDHFKSVPINQDLEKEYFKRCQFAAEIFKQPLESGKLLDLKIGKNGWNSIKRYRQGIEVHLGDGQKFSHLALRGAAGKIDMQILKIAANLHLLLRDDDYQAQIADNTVEMAINIANDLLESSLAICQAKGLIGQKAEFSQIIRIFEKDNKSRSERQITQSRSRVEPFKSYTGNKSTLIRNTLNEMVDQKLLVKQIEDSGVTVYRLAA